MEIITLYADVDLRHAEGKYFVVRSTESPNTGNLWIVMLKQPLTQDKQTACVYGAAPKDADLKSILVTSHASTHQFALSLCACQMCFLQIQEHLLQDKLH